MVRLLRTFGLIISSKPRFLHYLKKNLDESPRLENRVDTNFNPISAGTNATSIPKEAIVVDSADTNIQLSDSTLWGSASDTQYHASSLLFSITNGASLTYTFEGVAIW